MLKKLLVLPAFALASAAAHATPISSNTWYEFAFTTVGTPATGCAGGFCEPSSGTPTVAADAPPYTLTLTAGGTLLVQDAFMSGDVFGVYDFGTLIGTTNVPNGGSVCGSDPVVCSTDPFMSKGSFTLASGTHSLSFIPTQSIINSGAAYFDVVANPSAVTPEPSSIALLGTGLLGLAGAARRRFAA